MRDGTCTTGDAQPEAVHGVPGKDAYKSGGRVLGETLVERIDKEVEFVGAIEVVLVFWCVEQVWVETLVSKVDRQHRGARRDPGLVARCPRERVTLPHAGLAEEDQAGDVAEP